MAAVPPSSPFVLFGLPPDAPMEDIEYLLGEMTETLSRIDSKRGVLQEQIAAAAAARGSKRRASRGLAAVAPLPLLPPLGDDDHGALWGRRQRDAARESKKEQKRLEGLCGGLEEALVDAKEWLALQRGGTD